MSDSCNCGRGQWDLLSERRDIPLEPLNYYLFDVHLVAIDSVAICDLDEQ